MEIEEKLLPFSFTDQGIYMLASVLRGELAEQQSIFIMRAFREMRHYIKQNQQLSQKQVGVEVVLFTENGHGKRGFLTTAVVNDFIQEYPPLKIKPNADCHDRLIVLDYGLPTEKAYHCGASSKDAGKKLCAINVILETSMVHPVIDKLLLAPNKQI